MIWLLIFILSVIVFLVTNRRHFKRLYLSGLTLSLLGLGTEFAGQTLGYWRTEKEIIEMARAPFFLIGAYFFCGMLIARFNPRRIVHKLLFLAILVVSSSALEQMLIRLGYVRWVNMHILACLLVHTAVLSIVMLVAQRK
jgi:hypothetical protein